MRNILFLFFMLVLPVAKADVIHLKTGEKVDAKIIKFEGNYVKVEVFDSPTIYFIGEIDKITKGSDNDELNFDVALAQSVFTASGYDVTIKRLKYLIFVCLMRYDQRLTLAMAQRVNEIVNTAYNDELFLSAARDNIADNFDRSKIYDLRDFFSDESLMKIIDVERYALTSSGNLRMRYFTQELSLRPLDDNRAQALSRLDFFGANTSFVCEFVYDALSIILKDQKIYRDDVISYLKEQNEAYLAFLYSADKVDLIEKHADLSRNESLRWLNYILRSSALKINSIAANNAALSIKQYVDGILQAELALTQKQK